MEIEVNEEEMKEENKKLFINYQEIKEYIKFENIIFTGNSTVYRVLSKNLAIKEIKNSKNFQNELNLIS
jgi:hypothetical protein